MQTNTPAHPCARRGCAGQIFKLGLAAMRAQSPRDARLLRPLAVLALHCPLALAQSSGFVSALQAGEQIRSVRRRKLHCP
eukprot:scaffold523_cov446-Prasinococcus_capsulatus_cf.AAC.10